MEWYGGIIEKRGCVDISYDTECTILREGGEYAIDVIVGGGDSRKTKVLLASLMWSIVRCLMYSNKIVLYIIKAQLSIFLY